MAYAFKILAKQNIGGSKGIAYAIRRQIVSKRNTKLKERLNT